MKLMHLFILLTISQNSLASNAWIPKWVDGPATATYERTPTYLRTYVDLPKYGGHAQWTLNSSSPVSGSGSFVGPSSTATTPKISTNVKIPMGASAGAAAVATLTAVIPKYNLAKAAVALVRFNPYLSTALTLGWLANAGYHYLKDTDSFTQDAQPTTNVVYSASYGCPDSSTPPIACMVAAKRLNNGCSVGQYSYYCPQAGSYTETSNVWSLTWLPEPSGAPMNLSKSSTTIDPPSGSPPQSVTVEQVETGLSNKPVSGSADTAQAFDDELGELVKNGHMPDTDGATPTLNGPTTPVQGPKTTTTTPTGDVITSNTTYNNTYTNNYVDTTETTTVVTTPASGLPATTTTSGPPNSLQQSQSQPTDCDKYPGSLACSTFGDIPVADVIPTSIVSLSLSPSSLGSGSCPTPQVLDLHGQPDITLSYQRYCDLATGVSPVVIAFSWLTAGLLVIGGIREA